MGVLDWLGVTVEREEVVEAGVSERRAATADFQSVFKPITGKLGVCARGADDFVVLAFVV